MNICLQVFVWYVLISPGGLFIFVHVLFPNKCIFQDINLPLSTAVAVSHNLTCSFVIIIQS